MIAIGAENVKHGMAQDTVGAEAPCATVYPQKLPDIANRSRAAQPRRGILGKSRMSIAPTEPAATSRQAARRIAAAIRIIASMVSRMPHVQSPGTRDQNA